ncbi:unnamed protein product [Ectocarpus sp. 13 AM-2016]
MNSGIGVAGGGTSGPCHYSRQAANPARGVPRGERAFCNTIADTSRRTAACDEPYMGAHRRCGTCEGVDGYWRR